MNREYMEMKRLEVLKRLIEAGQTDFALQLIDADIALLQFQIERYEKEVDADSI